MPDDIDLFTRGLELRLAALHRGYEERVAARRRLTAERIASYDRAHS